DPVTNRNCASVSPRIRRIPTESIRRDDSLDPWSLLHRISLKKEEYPPDTFKHQMCCLKTGLYRQASPGYFPKKQKSSCQLTTKGRLHQISTNTSL
ncbi:hypothetical protein AVEN_123062-1, partial [Araneus ventricosus]